MCDRNVGMTPDKAQALVAGDLGQEMAKFPLRFCKPIYFGSPPSRQHPARINNGTVALLKTGEKFFGLTCEHVIREYCQRRNEGEDFFLRISNLHLDDPLSKLVKMDRVLDYAVFELSEEQAGEITGDSNGIGEAFYEAIPRPPALVEVGDFVAFGGFPGNLRKLASFDELDFGSYSSGACQVTDKHSDYFVCEFERKYWIRHFSESEPETLGGLSGGPAFAIRYASGISSYEFVGWVYQIHPETETLMMRHASVIWNILYDGQEA